MPSSRSTADIGFRALTADDLETLVRWLAEPRNAVHWGGPNNSDSLRDHLADPRVAQWIVTWGGTDVAYIQDYDIHAYQDHPLATLPQGARGMDTFIGHSRWMGQGLGPAYLARHARRLFDGGVPAVGVDPDPDNTAAIRAYEKAGFCREQIVHAKWGPARVMTLWPSSADHGAGHYAPETRSVLRRPAARYLDVYCLALRKGWSPDNLRPAAAQEQLDLIARDPQGFLDRMDDPEGKGPPVRLPTGQRCRAFLA